LPFDRLRVNGDMLKSFIFSVLLSLSKHGINLGNSLNRPDPFFCF